MEGTGMSYTDIILRMCTLVEALRCWLQCCERCSLRRPHLLRCLSPA